MIKGLAITPPVLGRISIGKVVEKNGKRIPEKDDQTRQHRDHAQQNVELLAARAALFGAMRQQVDVYHSSNLRRASPQAAMIVKSCVDSALQLGLPEARLPLAEAVLLLAGRMVQKPQAAASSGSLRTDTVLFGGLLLAVILLVGVLSFLPALALGPAAEFLRMAS